MHCHDLVSACSHVEDMVPVNPLTANVCIMTFGFKCYSVLCVTNNCMYTLWNLHLKHCVTALW